MKKLYASIGILCIIFALQLVVQYARVPSYIFPAPTSVFQVLIDDHKVLFDAFLITGFEWLIGVLCAIGLGFLIGFFSSYYGFLDKIFSPILLISQSVPYLVFVPILLLWFGLGFSSKIILITLTCVFPIALVFKNDLVTAQKEYGIIVKLLRLSPLKAFYHVYFPASLPGFFNALKISVSYAFGTTVVAELMGGEAGLGIFLLQAQYTYRIDRVMAVALIVVVVSVLSSKFVNLMASNVVFWNKEKK